MEDRLATAEEEAGLTSLEDEEAAIARKDRMAVATAALDQWALDAAVAVAAWDTWTAAQRAAATKVMLDRFGTLSARLADLIRWLDWRIGG